MAHSASVGSAKRTVDVAGKRLGIKKFGGEYVKPGAIIVRQKGTRFYPGINTDMGRDFTIFSKVEGFVNFRRMTGHKRDQKYVDILLKNTVKAEELKMPEKAVKARVKTTKTKAPAKVSSKVAGTKVGTKKPAKK